MKFSLSMDIVLDYFYEGFESFLSKTSFSSLFRIIGMD